jgi:hypothetical protein
MVENKQNGQGLQRKKKKMLIPARARPPTGSAGKSEFRQ